MSDLSRGEAMLDFIGDLYPICRSITGPGVRETLARIGEEVPIDVVDIPSGTQVFDWKIPEEWHIRSAYIVGPDGEKIVDFADHNLHVVNFSAPVNATMPLSELMAHLHSLPEHSEWIPYRTTYYARNWGFCLTDQVKSRMREGEYHVVIDSEFVSGVLNYGETFVKGQVEEEILVYSHICHPSIANDNLSGIAVTAWWAKGLLEGETPYYSYRFVWGPGTIGSIGWLATNLDKLGRIRHGLIAVLLGRPGPFHYKKSRSGDAEIDGIIVDLLGEQNRDAIVREFDPYGYDERQFCSPGINLPIGRLTRVPHGEYAEYHTSADNPGILSAEALEESLDLCRQIGDRLDGNRVYENLLPYGEPQLGKRGLYGKTGGQKPATGEYAMLWMLNQSDGTRDVASIARRSGLAFDDLRMAARTLEEHDVLRMVG